MKFKTQFNSAEYEKRYEKGGGLSLTVPDQSMTIQEILSRFARGLPVGGSRVPVYSGEDDDHMPANWHAMDFADRQEYVETHGDYIKQLKEEFEAEQKIRRESFIKPKKDTVETPVEPKTNNDIKSDK